MNNLNFSAMLKMQKELYGLHKDEWSPIEPEYGKDFFLWMIEEIGECISIIKKKGCNSVSENPNVRKLFCEEMSDVLMYYNDILLRFGITAEEISDAYIKKHNKNMKRNFSEEYKSKFE